MAKPRQRIDDSSRFSEPAPDVGHEYSETSPAEPPSDAAHADVPDALPDAPDALNDLDDCHDIDELGDQLVKARVKSALFQTPQKPPTISRFVLLDRIARGGMGMVYEAYDPQLDRRVAIKLLRPEMQARSPLAPHRLLREAQAIARVRHPNVVQVYEAGIAGAEVYVAMELIAGEPLGQWLKRHAPPGLGHWRLILDKFIAAGRGLAAVHKAGLLHRDFKPANVVVDERGEVRLIDFGLARAIDNPVLATDSMLGSTETIPVAGRQTAGVTAKQRAVTHPNRLEAGDREGARPDAAGATPAARAQGATPASAADELPTAPSRLTGLGMIVGTPAYMAPEQLTCDPVDARSDAFSLCVALYEALYGYRPFRGTDITTLRTSVHSGAIKLPPEDSDVPVWLERALMRALRTEPSERYEDVDALLAALTHEPTAHWKRWTAAAALVIGGLIGGITLPVVLGDDTPCAAVAELGPAATWTEARQSEAQAAFLGAGVPYAAATWQSLSAAIDSYIERWQHERQIACEATHVDATQTGDELILRNRCLDAQDARFSALATRLTSADEALIENAHDGLAFVGAPEHCRNPEWLMPDPTAATTPAAEIRVDAIRAAVADARVLALSGQVDAALAALDEQQRAAEALAIPALSAELQFHRGDIQLEYGGDSDRKPGTERLWNALDLAEASGHDRLAVDIWNALGSHREADLDPTQLGFWARRAISAAERLGDRGLRRAHAEQRLGSARYRQRRYDQAAAHQREALALAEANSPPPLDVADILHDLANTLDAQGHSDAARDHYERALATARATLGDRHPRVLALQFDFADFLIADAAQVAARAEQRGPGPAPDGDDGDDSDNIGDIGDDGDAALERARAALERALAIRTDRHGAVSTKVAHVHIGLANLEAVRGHYDDAETHARTALALYEQIRGPAHRDVAEPLMHLGLVCYRAKRYDEALQHWQRELAIRLANDIPAEALSIGLNQSNLGEALIKLGRHRDALARFDRAQARYDAFGATPTPFTALVNKGRGMALLGLGRAAEASAYLDIAIRLLREEPITPIELADTAAALSQALRAQAKPASGDTTSAPPHANARADALAAEAEAIYRRYRGR